MRVYFTSRFTYVMAITAICIIASCKSKVQTAQNNDGSYVFSAADTMIDIKAVHSRIDSYIATNRLDDAASFINVNLRRFSGKDKAALLTSRGLAYYLKDDLDHSIADYLAAYEIDPQNPTYVMNVANTYTELNSKANALLFANKVMELTTASDSDRAAAKVVIDKLSNNDATH